jgi:hypothetical protein
MTEIDAENGSVGTASCNLLGSWGSLRPDATQMPTRQPAMARCARPGSRGGISTALWAPVPGGREPMYAAPENTERAEDVCRKDGDRFSVRHNRSPERQLTPAPVVGTD